MSLSIPPFSMSSVRIHHLLLVQDFMTDDYCVSGTVLGLSPLYETKQYKSRRATNFLICRSSHSHVRAPLYIVVLVA